MVSWVSGNNVFPTVLLGFVSSFYVILWVYYKVFTLRHICYKDWKVLLSWTKGPALENLKITYTNTQRTF